jgi:hypothetical protein
LRDFFLPFFPKLLFNSSFLPYLIVETCFFSCLCVRVYLMLSVKSVFLLISISYIFVMIIFHLYHFFLIFPVSIFFIFCFFSFLIISFLFTMVVLKQTVITTHACSACVFCSMWQIV